jgi:hypothetical protein
MRENPADGRADSTINEGFATSRCPTRTIQMYTQRPTSRSSNNTGHDSIVYRKLTRADPAR